MIDDKKVRQYFNSLTGLSKVFDEAAASAGSLGDLTIDEYVALLADAERDIPGLLLPFDKIKYQVRIPGYLHVRYEASPVKIHVARNTAILKTIVDTSIQTPFTETKSFGFVSDEALKKILERDFQEIQKGAISGNWKSVIILSGGSIEAILLDLLGSNSQQSLASIKAPKEADLNKWDLNNLIEVAVEEKLVDSGVAKLSHSVREYRNLIHPGVEIRSGLKVEPEEAKIAIEVLKILIRELS